MQRLYAFWPSLEVEVLNENEPEKNNEEEDGEGHTAIRSEQQGATGGGGSSRPHTPRGKSPGGSAMMGSMSVERSRSPSVSDGHMIQAVCCVRLVWPDRHKTNKIFREPDFYEPNINCI
jgi:hypothetical protein